MKRLLALIMAAFFSITNNVDFQANSDEEFDVAGYYKLEGNEPPDYRYLYQNYSTQTSTGNCLSKSSIRQLGPVVHLTELSPYKYWFDYSEEAEVTGDFINALPDTTTYTFSGETDIVAPQAMIVKTKSTDGGGHSMLLTTTDGKYTIYVSGMERWFCCRNRAIPKDTDPMTYSWTHSSNVYGYTIPQGYLIGKAVSGTTVSIQDANSRPVTLTDFYTN